MDDIEAAFFRVRASVEKSIGGDEALKDQSFQEIFALNNEIGRLAREVPSTMQKMKELQGCVNTITVALKYDKEDGLREGLSNTEEAIRALRRGFSTTS